MDKIEVKQKKTWLVTVLWIYYFFKFLLFLSFLNISISLKTLSEQNSYTNNISVAFYAINILSFFILFLVCLKRKRIAFKIVPGLELFLWLLTFAYTLTLPVPTGFPANIPIQVFIYSLLSLLIRPIITTSIVYGSKAEFVG